jgi:hypothetical protein
MKHTIPLLLVLFASPWFASAQQAPIIRLSDLHTQPGLYYRAYANAYEPIFGTPYPVNSRMGSAGPDRFWDFSQGPTDRTLRFDYLGPAGIPEAADFPQATIVERKTVEESGVVEWLMIEPAPGLGRRVHGFYSDQFSPGMPSIPFSQPIVDFPDGIRYQDTWTTSMITESLFPSLDPEVPTDFPMQTTWNSTFVADAWGRVLLPNLGLLDVLRINEELTVDVAANWDGSGYQHLVTEYVRNYYWLSPGRGIVAELHSTQHGTTPPADFAQATAFVRMFETNKKPGAIDDGPQPAGNVRLVVSNNHVLVQWQKAANASRYRVEWTDDLLNGEWTPLVEETANDYFFDPVGPTNKDRFYRVVSLP